MKFSKAELSFRMLSYLDYNEFKRAAIESVESNIEYLYFGEFFKTASALQMFAKFDDLLKDPNTDHYGIFHGNRLLGHIAITRGLSPLGSEIYGWVRKGFHNKGIGEIGLKIGGWGSHKILVCLEELVNH